jgi:hypothetical protein
MGLSNALRAASLLALIALATAFVVAPAFAVTYTVSVQTDRTSYTSGQSIMISGTVSPAPGANTAVVVTIRNPANTVVDISDDPVNPSTGAFSQVTVAGGTANWVPGTYAVNATWGGYGSTATLTTTFAYGSPSTSSSSSSTTTTTSTTSTSTSKTTTSSSSSTTTTTTSPPTTTSSSATVLPTTSSSSSSSTTTSTTETGGGLGSLTYVIVAAVAIVVVGIAIVLWRRRVASGFSGKSTAP